MIRKLSALFILIFSCSCLLAADLAQLREIYDSEMRKFEYQNRKDLLRLPQEHIKRLSELEDSFRAAGDLPSLLAVRKERERFIGNPRADAIVIASKPPQLAALQKRYVDEYKTAKGGKDVRQKDLTEKYLRALKAMQRELTRQNKIEEALAVMKEIERINKGGAPGAGGASSSGSSSRSSYTPAAVPAVRALDLAGVRKALHGKILRWNPSTQELSVDYDFTVADQADDWQGGTIDDIDAAMVCDRRKSQFVLPFKSVSQLSFEVLFQGGVQRARVSLGRQLNVDVIGDDVAQAIVWQGSEQDPVLRRVPSLRSAIANRCELEITGKKASLSVNYDKAGTGRLQAGLMAPLTVGLGFSEGSCAFQRVVITGILAPEALEYLSQHSR